jgi:hypothetical protein
MHIQILAKTAATLAEVSHGFVNLFSQISGQCLNEAMNTSFKMLFNSLIILPFDAI